MPRPICPILSIRNTQIDELCVEEQCALWLPQTKRCSIVYMGLKAAMDVQAAQAKKSLEGADP